MKSIRFFNWAGSKRYLTKIYMWVTAVIFCIVIVFSLIVYFNTEKIVLDNEYQSNTKILYQTKYYIEYIDELIKSTCVSLFLNEDVQFIINTDSIDYAVLASYMNKVSNSIIAANIFIDSAYIYNNNSKNYYSIKGDALNDKNLKSLIEKYEKVPKLQPILRKVNVFSFSSENMYKNVFTYFMYDGLDMNHKMGGALIINIDFDWMLNNIKALNQMNKEKYDKIFIFNDSGEVSGNDNIDEKLDIVIKNSFEKYRLQSKEAGSKAYFDKINIENREFLITAVDINSSDLTVFKVQDYEEVFTHIKMLKTTILVIGIPFLLLTIIVSFRLSTYIYKPVKKLIGFINSNQADIGNLQKQSDEFAYLNEVYTKSLEQIKEYKFLKKTNKEIVIDYFFKKLLIDSSSVSDEEFIKTMKENSVPLNLNSGFGVCLLKVDNYRIFIDHYNPKDRKLFKFAIMNILDELVSEYFPCLSVDMGDDKIVLIINTRESEVDFTQRIIPVLMQTQKCIYDNYKIVFSCTLSDSACTLKAITESYNEVLKNSRYRFILGNECIVVPEKIKNNIESTKTNYSIAYERNLKDSIKSRNLEKVSEYLSKIFEEITEMDINNIMLSTTNLINTLKNTYEEMNAARLITTSANLNFFSIDFIEKETASVLFSMLMDIVANSSINENEYRTEKQNILVDAIKDIIHTNFHDSSLCLQGIARILKLNHLYIGKVFKIQTQISVNDYINEVRLVKAAELLKDSRLSIQDISLEVGIDNQNYFYTLFKKKYGSTPKEYSLNKVLKG